MAIFDYDVAGVKNGDEQPRKMVFEYKSKYCYFADIPQEDVVNQEEINRYCVEINTSSIIGKRW